MIYETVAADMRALAHEFTELSGEFAPIAAELVNAGQAVPAAAVNDLGIRAGSLALRLTQRSAQVAAQPTMAAAVQFGEAEFRNCLAQVTAYNQEFDQALRNSPPGNATWRRARVLLAQIHTQAEQALEDIQETGTVLSGPAANLGRLRGTIDDLASYPILTSGEGSGPGLGTPSRVADGLQARVDNAIQATIGRLPRYTDHTAFLSALTSSFEVSEVQGHTVATWRPRAYLGPSELGGGVTGAQASLYARAQDALDRALPLLKAFRPLRPDADMEEMESARSIIQAQFTAVVTELGIEGGPRPARVDQLFATLLDDPVTGIGDEQVVGGMVGYLARSFGFEAGQINTVSEEQAYSDFLLLRDYLTTTRAGWDAFRREFLGRDLGTRLVLLSNALQVVAESVDEVEAALDSVFVGAGERSVAQFSTGPSEQMLVSELLSWVRSFATQETRELVQSGGRRAMGIVTTTAGQLQELVTSLITAAGSDAGLPRGMRHPRVRHPLEELRTYLGRVTQLARDVEQARTS
ncbi:hypothetical protein [Jidongwangia harbinensis]|uniref:hypothetical protein n=1 Tax=Jidongwangia harbinensis TaxID=2878561 RepID=UPI001CD9A74D|nr:hypothetical protein [Jidongwangia harbinensis]MCA2213907.1 hypothetical protein [Jidongwangia harbinensis]